MKIIGSAAEAEKLQQSMKQKLNTIRQETQQIYRELERTEQSWQDEGYQQIRKVLLQVIQLMSCFMEDFKRLLSVLKQYEEILAEPNRRIGAIIAGLERNADPMTVRCAKHQIADYLTKNGMVQRVSFGRLDVRIAAEMGQAIAETKILFPELNLKFAGSIQERNRQLKEQLTASYLCYYQELNPGIPVEKLLLLVKQDIEKLLQVMEPGERTIAQSISAVQTLPAPDHVLSGFEGISVNESCGDNYESFVGIKQQDVCAGWKPFMCDTPKATMDHELGHQIAGLTAAHEDEWMQTRYRQFCRMDKAEKSAVLSGYAGENIHDFIAEAWSEYRNNPDCRPCAKAVAERMLALYQKRRRTEHGN